VRHASTVTSPADSIVEAFDSKHLIEPLTDANPDLDEAGAYEVARDVHARRVLRGERPVGRKIGFTNRTIWAEYGIWAPIWGHVYDSTVRYSAGKNTELAIDHLLQPRLEPEIQVHFARTPPVTRGETAILESIDWIALGYEIVQCPYPKWRFRAADSIAAYALHGALVVGTPVAVSEIADSSAGLRALTVSLARNGELQAVGNGADVLDSPVLALAHLLEVLAAQPDFEPVSAGEIVSTGTLTPLQPVARGETWSAQVEGINLPDLSITLA
jgi:2-oxo-3-hexenedioate decarboxylase